MHDFSLLFSNMCSWSISSKNFKTGIKSSIEASSSPQKNPHQIDGDFLFWLVITPT